MTLIGLPGKVLLLGRAASVQFALNPILFRVTRVLPHDPPWGWVWLVGYQLGDDGQAVALREVMVRLDGIQEALRAPTVPRQLGAPALVGASR